MSQQKFIIQQNFSKVMQTLDCFTGEIELQVTIGIKSFFWPSWKLLREIVRSFVHCNQQHLYDICTLSGPFCLLNLNVTLPYSYIQDQVVDTAQYSVLTIKMETDVVMITAKFTVLLYSV